MTISSASSSCLQLPLQPAPTESHCGYLLIPRADFLAKLPQVDAGQSGHWEVKYVGFWIKATFSQIRRQLVANLVVPAINKTTNSQNNKLAHMTKLIYSALTCVTKGGKNDLFAPSQGTKHRL